MSAAPLSAGGGDLRRVAERLGVPLPRRVRILRELAADLDALTARFQAEGCEPGEARRRAAELVLPGEASLAALNRVHEPRYRRLTRRVPPDRLRLVERSALALATLGVVVAGWTALAGTDLLAHPSPFLLPVAGVGLAALAAVLAKAFDVWIRQDHAAPRRGLTGVLVLSVAPVPLAFLGLAVDILLMAAALEADPSRTAELTLRWLQADSVLLAVGLLLTLTGCLGWFVVSRWAFYVEGQVREVLRSAQPDPTRRS